MENALTIGSCRCRDVANGNKQQTDEDGKTKTNNVETQSRGHWIPVMIDHKTKKEDLEFGGRKWVVNRAYKSVRIFKYLK
uniref:Uncharacterized protein n=1 Tax=Cucumis melo TaxID=3656 RepID=A0A9I9CLX8_CUCME